MEDMSAKETHEKMEEFWNIECENDKTKDEEGEHR